VNERRVTYVVAGVLTVYLTDKARGLTLLPILSEGALIVGAVLAALAVGFVCYLVRGFIRDCRKIERAQRFGGSG
jgi:uncharacterized membrane protein YhdT